MAENSNLFGSRLQVNKISYLKLYLLYCSFFLNSAISADRYWVGSGNWNDTAHWSASSGGSGGASIPGSSDNAIFDGNSGNCTINVNINVAMLKMASGYGGTITQSDHASITLASSSSITNWIQEAGTFIGSTNSIKMNSAAHALYFTGGLFMSGSNQRITTAGGHWTVSGGILQITNSVLRMITDGSTMMTGSMTVGNIEFAGTSGNPISLSIPSAVTITSKGYIRWTETVRFINIQNGTLAAEGDVDVGTYGTKGNGRINFTGSGNQSLSGNGGYLMDTYVIKPSGKLSMSGTIRMAGNKWVYKSGGELESGNSTLEFRPSSAAAAIITGGTHRIYNLSIASSDGNPVYVYNRITNGPLKVGGNLILSDQTVRSINLSYGTYEIEGDLIVDKTNGNYGGTSVLCFSGTNEQNWTYLNGDYSRLDNNIEINKTSGRVILGTRVTLDAGGQRLVVKSGTIDLSDKVLRVIGNNGIYSNSSASRLKMTIDSSDTRIYVTGTGGKAYISGSLYIDLAQDFTPNYSDKIVILTSATPVVVNSPFVKMSPWNITYDVLYNDEGNNVVLTHIRRHIAGTVFMIK